MAPDSATAPTTFATSPLALPSNTTFDGGCLTSDDVCPC